MCEVNVFASRAAPRVRRDVLRELGLVALAALAYFGVRNLTVGSAETAFANADRLRRLEDALSMAWEDALQTFWVNHDVLVTLVNWVYIWGHWPVIVGVGIFLYRRRRDRYRLLRNAMFVSGAIGFLFFAFFPVAPPRLVDPTLVDTVTVESYSYRALQPPGLTNQYAAFPSLHFGWNVLVGIAFWGATRRRVLRTLAVAGPAAMGVAVVATANHYIVDLAGGLVVILFGLLAAQRLTAPRAGRNPPLKGCEAFGIDG